MRNKANRLEELFVRCWSNAAREVRNERRRRSGALEDHRLQGIHRILRIWGQTLVPPAITMTLYFVIFGSLIGARIGEMGGCDYMRFHRARPDHDVVIQNSYGNVVSPSSAPSSSSIEELLVSRRPRTG
jgi:ABC-2 type transport system permease protein